MSTHQLVSYNEIIDRLPEASTLAVIKCGTHLEGCN